MAKDNLTFFFELIEDQFQYGGKKYAQTDTKESTDCLFDDFGKNWLFGTIGKYCKRYSNLTRERDLLKIATYMFILWLKRGFHIDDKRIAPIDTTVKTKTKHFPLFKEKVIKHITDAKDFENPSINKIFNNTSYRLSSIYDDLKKCADIKFYEVEEYDLLRIFYNAYRIWSYNIKDKGKDLDTYNEEKKNG